MEKREEVKKAIGKKPFQLLLDEITDGPLTTDHLKQMAILMKGGVNSVHKANKDTKEDVFVFRLMMDKWYSTTIYKKEVRAFELLITILNTVCPK